MIKRNTNPADDLFFNMAGILGEADAAQDDDALLSSMLGELDELMMDDDDQVKDEIVENSLEAVVADIQKAEADSTAHAEQGEVTEVIEADKPATDSLPEVVKVETPAEEKKTKQPKEPKAPRVTSITHKPGDRLLALLGGDKAWLAFNKLDDDEAAEKRADSFIEAMNDRDAIADKVRDKAVILITWMASGKDKSALNEVLLRAFTVLFKDGELTSGAQGNLRANLLSKPYSPGTANSQSSQMFMLFPLLGITKKEKGRMVIDPDSAIVDVMKMKLGV